MATNRIIILAIIITSFCSTCTRRNNSSGDSDTLAASSLHAFGRVMSDQSGSIGLVSAASHVGFTFEGSECRVIAHINDENGHNYLQYEIDGEYQKRVKISGGNKQPLLITAPGAGPHTVWIYKATEAHTGPVFIEKIIGKNVKSSERPVAPLIEFIGNSITCGAAADPSEVPCGAGVYHDQHNAFYAYGPRVAKELKTNFILSCVSGIGIYRNWNSDGPTMPQVYENGDLQYQSEWVWDFSKYQPRVVSIALGTNDFSNGDGIRQRLAFDSAVFVAKYIAFVQLVKSRYPAAQVVLLSSPMADGPRRVTLQNCLTAVKKAINGQSSSDKGVEVFFFNPMQARGCTGHPNIEDHAILAKELAPFLKKYL
jgi:lysophospholipase L1-like esterase